MCGRYSITSPPEAIQRVFQVPERPNMQARYNVAPTQDVPAVRPGEDGRRHLVNLRWGLIPFWAKDAGIASKLINARAESVATTPAFRAAFRRRRCLIVADGFYEWKKPEKKGARKQPYRITRKDGEPFAFAGLWERWSDPESQSDIETCTIVTTDANALLAPIHGRMPVILNQDGYETWLDTAAEQDTLAALLRPCSEDLLSAYPISTRVNKVEHDDASVIEPLDRGQLDTRSSGSQGSLF